MTGKVDNPEQSPEFFQPPQRPDGIRRINWRLLGSAIGVFVLLFGGAVIYTYYDRFNPSTGSGNGSDEPITITEVAASPIKRPTEQVSYARPMPIPVEVGAPAVPGLTEEEKRRIAKKIADEDEAMRASPRVENTGPAPGRQPSQQQNTPMMPPPNITGLVPPPVMPGDAEDGGDGNIEQQAHKREFMKASENRESPYLQNTRMNPVSEFEVAQGWLIPGVMISGVNSQLPGPIYAQVRQNVYDSATGRFVLIPAGSKLIGTYDSEVSAGQERVLIAWTDVVLPDGSYLRLGAMPGVDKSGIAGMNDKVNNHYWRTFGQAALLSLFTAATQLSQTRGSVSGNYSASQILAAAVGMQGFNLGAQLIRRNLNIQPTLEIRPGMEFNIAVTKRIVLPPWRGHSLAVNQTLMDGSE